LRGRLFLINLLLLAAIGGAAMELKKLLDQTRKREEMVRSQAPKLPAAKAGGGRAAPSKRRPRQTIWISPRVFC
jgi:predicted lipid-binding transport protein (Tim44 family)